MYSNTHSYDKVYICQFYYLSRFLSVPALLFSCWLFITVVLLRAFMFTTATAFSVLIVFDICTGLKSPLFYPVNIFIGYVTLLSSSLYLKFSFVCSTFDAIKRLSVLEQSKSKYTGALYFLMFPYVFRCNFPQCILLTVLLSCK